MLDLDYFKLLNDNYGHQCGDMVLIEISKLITTLLRLEDVFGRYGGEEFAIVLPETNMAGALDLAERICSKVAEKALYYKGELLNITISLGVAQLSNNESSYEDLITYADNALYQAKEQGRNRVCATSSSAST